MLTTPLVYILGQLMMWFGATLPDFSIGIPAGMLDTLYTMLSLDPILPVREVFVCLGMTWIFMFVLATVKITKWVIEQLNPIP